MERVGDNDFRSIATSKKQLLMKLAINGRFVLPPASLCSYRYLRQILRGEKLLLRIEDLKLTEPPPRVRGLSVKGLWEEVRTDERLLRYFPDFKQGWVPPRTYFFQVLSSLYPEDYGNFLKRVKEEKLGQQQAQKHIEIDQNILETLGQGEDLFTYLPESKPSNYLHSNRRYRGWDN
jgi:hypothetical protein